jgi:hypothetical protein
VVQAGTAQAALTQTAITSPGDPSYFYDPTGGATGAFTVTGTTDSTDPATDQVDIDCYSGNGGGGESYQYTLVPGVSLDANGNFSQAIPYSDLESNGFFNPVESPNGSVCRLLAVPAGTQPTTGLDAYAGPRVLLSYLATAYTGDGTTASDYILVAPALGATDIYTGVGDCGLVGTFVNDATVFGQYDAQGFNCADTEVPLWEKQLNPSTPDGGLIDVDGTPASSSYQAAGNPADGSFEVAVSATQDPATGDMTIQESDPLAYDPGDQVFASLGVTENRTIQQTESGHVVLITDQFLSTDGSAHVITLNVENETCFLALPCGIDQGSYPGSDGFDPTNLSFELPGQSSYCLETTCYPDGANPSVTSSTSPSTVYVENPSAGSVGVYGAITSFTAPYASGNYTFAESPAFFNPVYKATYQENSLGVPYVLSVPAGGSAALSIAYTTDASQSAVNADIQAATALQQAGVPSAPGSSVPTSTTASSTNPPSVTSPAVSGSSSSTNIGSQNVTAYVGPTYHPIANTLGASRRGHRSERLRGEVIAGSGAVSYYFDYGATRHYGRRTRTFQLTAGESIRNVTLTVKKLTSGKTYHYRVVAIGADGDAIGADRTFTAGRL